MTQSKSFLNIYSIGALALVSILLAGCGCIPCGNGGDTSVDKTPSGRSYIQMAPIAPPPPLFEEAHESTSPRAEIWRPGYWQYNGSNFSWISGEMIDRPSPTAVWSADHWTQHTYGWGFVPCFWQ